MKELVKKEIKLAASPLSYIFIAFALMTLIPQYPILIGAFFVCFGVFQTFRTAREQNDILYSAMLPVKKTDVVRAKYLFTVMIQAVGFAAMSALVALRVGLLNNYMPYTFNSMMNANLAYLGWALAIFAEFNVFFVGGFFKTAYKIGMPFLAYAISALLTIIVGEALHFFPGLDVINANYHWSHIVILVIGILLYAVSTVVSLRLSERNFDKIDL